MKQNRVYKMAMDRLKEEVYDFQSEFSDEQIATCVMNVICRLNCYGGIHQQTVCADLGDCAVKVKNAATGSFVSVSTPVSTGVSRCLVEILDTSKKAESEDVEILLDMLNEAWYAAMHECDENDED